MSDDAAPSARRKSWIVFVPLALFLLVAVIWSGVWVYASNRAEREIEAWVAREARLGRIWNCGERHLAGYPFRFELKCRSPSLETRGGDSIIITAASAQVVAQIWAPNHIVAEFQAPARVMDRGSGKSYAATWQVLQMSGVGDLSGQPQRFSVQVMEPRLQEAQDPGAAPAPAPAPATSAAAPGSGDAVIGAHLVEFHVRRTPGPSGALDNVDFAFGAKNARAAVLDRAGSPGPLDVTIQGTVTAAADLRPMPVEQRLRAWAAAGGVARLERLALTTPTVAATASGALSVDPAGLLNGKLDLGFAGFQDLVAGLGRAGAIPSDLAPIVSALAMVGKPTTVEGRRGVSYALSFNKGALRFGPLQVGFVPPLF
ncbi:DUF2125 domain-containing protein [Xanthobacter tagetidis]|uniref:DUF2125 domain-containing protein n=1 Tax=Xanthobacter tagetidis TaxID=60216 RepID=A0A3L7A4I6_9HYPH|nr:DUF2125 domain-containing protein [Xanthobacter tagetidis]MBB6309245.1 hypothetical protein [Xanthobacter tagetidis]RLP74202.1 DUF2125 domain-containing protein [Xanthobacter tagetidis]